MISVLGRMIQLVAVVSFVGLLMLRELLRAYDSERSRVVMGSLFVPTVIAGTLFAIVIGERLYDLTT